MMGAIPICDGVFYLHDIVEYSQCPTKISPDVTVALRKITIIVRIVGTTKEFHL